jgi:hypothetical protein
VGYLKSRPKWKTIRIAPIIYPRLSELGEIDNSLILGTRLTGPVTMISSRTQGWSNRRTTGVSNSYRSRQPFSPGAITSTSLKMKGRASQTVDSVSLAFVHKEQLARVKRVIRQECCSKRCVGIIGAISSVQ